jgi:hypothetical protein
MNYRFDLEHHIHFLENKPLMGGSSITRAMPKQLTWWASGKCAEVFGWTPTKSEKLSRLENASLMLEKIREMNVWIGELLIFFGGVIIISSILFEPNDELERTKQESI